MTTVERKIKRMINLGIAMAIILALVLVSLHAMALTKKGVITYEPQLSQNSVKDPLRVLFFNGGRF